MNAFFSIMAVPFAACVLMFLILNYMGIHVLMREIVFIDIALAQISAVGALVSMLIFGHNPAIAEVLAFGFCLLAAAFFSFVRKKNFGISMETVIGVSYAITAAAALFLISKSAQGHTHAKHMFEGSILWATSRDISMSLAIFSACAAFFYIFRKKFLENSSKYMESVSTDFWNDFLFYSLFAAVITLSVKMGGVLLVFAFLIIPVVVASLFYGGIQKRLIVSWAVSLIASATGLLFSYYFDFSIGPSIVAFLGLILALVSCIKRKKFSFW